MADTPLDEERAFLLRSLHDLEAERAAGDIDDADYEALRDDYTVRAAAALRDEPASPAAALPRHPGRGRMVMAVLTVVALAVAAGLFVAGSAGERIDGEALSGSIRQGVTGDLARARALVRQGEVLEAIKLYDRILAEDPAQPEALANRGWLLRLAGVQASDAALIDRGEAFVDRAIAADPAFAQARFFKAMMLMEDRDRPADAVPEFEAFLRLAPDDPLRAVVESALAQARNAANAP
jgi:tetratricopeptide (TPR) repeat protein